jgi:hypothetical protein
MTNRLTLQELAIAVAAQQHNPTLLTPDFLKYSGVVPSDWQLARPPVLSNSASQVIFQNGISILAQANRIIFSEVIADKAPADVEVAAIARKYVEALPQIIYQGVGINLRGHVSFTQNDQAAHNYIFKHLLAAGPWHDYGTGKPQATLRFTYPLDQTRLDLEIAEVGVKQGDQEAVPAVLFTGVFSHTVTADTSIADLIQTIDGWQTDLSTFQDVINTRFLKSKTAPEITKSDVISPRDAAPVRESQGKPAMPVAG